MPPYDQHVHSWNSFDCKSPPADNVEHALASGLAGLSFTDHFDTHPDEWDGCLYDDARIAREPFPQTAKGRLMKWDNEYVLSRVPRIIAINRGYFEPGDPRAQLAARNPAVLARSPMDRDLFQRVARDGSYRLHPILLEDGSVFFVFRRVDDGD